MSSRSQKLFQFLVDIANNVEASAKLFSTGLHDLAHPEALAIEIKEHEKTGDVLVRDLVTLLNSTYITPLEREDFLELSLKMDDIVDGFEASTERFDLYNVTSANPIMLDFARIIQDCAVEIGQAITLLSNRKMTDIRVHVEKIHELEKEADTLLRYALRKLFLNPTDPIEVIKYKELYEILEGITDRCKDVADGLGSVVVKNA